MKRVQTTTQEHIEKDSKMHIYNSKTMIRYFSSIVAYFNYLFIDECELVVNLREVRNNMM